MVSSMRMLGLRLLWLWFFNNFRVLWVVVCEMFGGGVVGGGLQVLVGVGRCLPIEIWL